MINLEFYILEEEDFQFLCQNDEDDIDCLDEEIRNARLRDELRSWALKHRIKH